MDQILRIFQKKSQSVFLAIVCCLFLPIGAFAASEAEPEEFDAGHYVIEHVMDSHEWHIAEVGGHHFSIPLPIILYSWNSGLHVFMSTKFHHETMQYRDFKFATNGANKGKIIELNADGTEFLRLPIDLSITKTVAGILVAAILLFFLLRGTARSLQRNVNTVPTGLQNLIEPIVIFVRDEVAKPVIGDKRYEKFMPFLLTMFFFILINNLAGLIPIFPFGSNVTGNIAVTMVLALFTFFATIFNGKRHYWKEIFNPDVPMFLKFPIPLMPIVELSGMITKPFVLMVRLFGNMVAGHMIVLVFVSLIFIFNQMLGPAVGVGISFVSVFFGVFITLLDILVSFIQAFVFTLLSAVYFGMAVEEHH